MLKKRFLNVVSRVSGRLPSQVKKAEVMASCTICLIAIRMTKTNTEAKMHVGSRHAGTTFAECFPGQFDPTTTAAVAAAAEAPSGGGKLDIDRIRAEAREKKSIAEGGVPKSEKKKVTKKKEDLSHLFAAAEITASGKKKK